MWMLSLVFLWAVAQLWGKEVPALENVPQKPVVVPADTAPAAQPPQAAVSGQGAIAATGATSSLPAMPTPMTPPMPAQNAAQNAGAPSIMPLSCALQPGAIDLQVLLPQAWITTLQSDSVVPTLLSGSSNPHESVVPRLFVPAHGPRTCASSTRRACPACATSCSRSETHNYAQAWAGPDWRLRGTSLSSSSAGVDWCSARRVHVRTTLRVRSCLLQSHLLLADQLFCQLSSW